MGVPGSGKKDTIKVLGEHKAVAIEPCDFIELAAIYKRGTQILYVKEFA